MDNYFRKIIKLVSDDFDSKKTKEYKINDDANQLSENDVCDIKFESDICREEIFKYSIMGRSFGIGYFFAEKLLK